MKPLILSTAAIKELVKDRQDIPPIRIIASRGGCCGSVFSIGFDIKYNRRIF
jgi:hypothetical protein